MTLACEACACSRYEEKSDDAVGVRTEPTTVPPAAWTAADASFSRLVPNTVSLVRKNHELSPRLISPLVGPRPSE